MGWAALTLVTDDELATYEPETTNGHWGPTTWPNQRASAKLELKTWLETDYRATIGDDIADRIRDTYAADKLWGFTAATYSDVSTQAADDTENDIDLSTVFVTVSDDRLYIGHPSTFDGIEVSMHGALNTVASVLTVKYSGPSGWATLSATDGTSNSGKAFGQSGRVTWTQPADWQRRTLNNSADAYYWMELSVSAALTAGTSVSQALIVKPPDGLKRVCLLIVMGYITQHLAAQSPSTDYWLFKARNQFKTGYLDQAERKYSEMRDKGGIPIDVDGDNQIDQAETLVPSPLRIGRA